MNAMELGLIVLGSYLMGRLISYYVYKKTEDKGDKDNG